ncbi:MAG: ABC transporter ATP-binding protein [Chitinophagales bacterium]
MNELIEIKSLQKRFKAPVLSGVDFTLYEGQTVGLIGINGAGKTTLIKIILGFLNPNAGTVRVCGKKPGQTHGIGYLPEKPDYHLLFSGRDYLHWLARLSGISGRGIEEILCLVGMEGRADQRMSKYSKGMLQRIGIAQAILTDPPLVILDEPLSGLDPAGQKDLRDIIIELQKREKSILLSSHLLPEVERICTDVAILHEGKIIHHGNINTVLTQQNSYHLGVENLPTQIYDNLCLDFMMKLIDQNNLIFTEKVKGEKEVFLKRLLDNEVVINELNPEKRSLEDFFISSTKGK